MSKRHARSNAQLIQRLQKNKSFCDVLINYARNNPLVELIPPNQLEEIYLLMDSNLATRFSYVHGRSKIPTWAHPILIQVEQTTVGVREVARQFFDRIKAVHALDPKKGLAHKAAEIEAARRKLEAGTTSDDRDFAKACAKELRALDRAEEKLGRKYDKKPFSPKRVRQILSGEIPAYCAALEPISEDHARARGYFGQACPRCKGYRTAEAETADPSLLKCFKCSHLTEFTFPKRARQACPSCHWWFSEAEEAKIRAGEGQEGPCPSCGSDVSIRE